VSGKGIGGHERVIPDGLFKCCRCGKTLPVEAREPGLPEVWASCKGCVVRERLRRNEWTNPLGPTAEASGGI
jgi:hypothetical protein